MNKRKICVVTGTRAEYGLLQPVLRRIRANANLQLQLVVTGMHLSPEFGLTYKQIENDFIIDKKTEILLSSDTAMGVNKAMGLAQISFTEIYDDLQPNILLVLGDRFEIFSAVSAAMMMNIPIAHISGGEITGGAIDDSIRHAITKMSHLHFVATEIYRQRVIQMGEHPDRVFNFGEAGLDNILDLKLLTKGEFEDSIKGQLKKRNLLITYHPETRESNNLERFQTVLSALDSLEDTLLIFTKANADEGGREINTLIDDFVVKNKNKSMVFSSLGQLRYLSALQYVDAVVGNTSSGIVEAPSFKIATVNIGDRQKGRIQAESVLNCKADKKDVLKAIETIYTSRFQTKLQEVENPYGKGNASERTVEVLKNFPLENIISKEFVDI